MSREFRYRKLPCREKSRRPGRRRTWSASVCRGWMRTSGSAARPSIPSDVHLPNMLYGAILRCPHPHARVRQRRHERSVQDARDPSGHQRHHAGSRSGVEKGRCGGNAPIRPSLPLRGRGGGGGRRRNTLPGPGRHKRHPGRLRGAAVRGRRAQGAASRVPARSFEGQSIQDGHLRTRRCGQGFCGCRCGAGRDLPHRVRAAHSPRASRLCRQLGGKLADRLGIHSGGLRDPVQGRRSIKTSAGAGAGHRPLHGGRVRKQARGRQVHRHRRPAGQTIRPSGEVVFDARGDLPCRGEPAPLQHDAQGRCQAGRDAHGAGVHLSRYGRRLPGRRNLAGGLAHSRSLHLPQRAHDVHRRLHQCRPGPGVPRARPPAGGLGAGADDGCPGGGRRHGPGSAQAEKHLEPSAKPARATRLTRPPASRNASSRELPPSAGKRRAGKPAQRPPKATCGGGSEWQAACGLRAAAGRRPP